MTEEGVGQSGVNDGETDLLHDQSVYLGFFMYRATIYVFDFLMDTHTGVVFILFT